MSGWRRSRSQRREHGEHEHKWVGSTVQSQQAQLAYLGARWNSGYNSVDASLWYIITVHDCLQSCRNQQPAAISSDTDRQKLQDAMDAILTGYVSGTRFGIKVDDDSLLSCGQAGIQLTWMDAKVGDWVVTPRIGKPVEVQALWLNAEPPHTPRGYPFQAWSMGGISPPVGCSQSLSRGSSPGRSPSQSTCLLF